MLLSDFPPEILIKLTNYLSIKDKATCSLVCRSWTQFFQDSMHSDLFLTTKGDLLDAVDLRQDYKQKYEETRNLVRYLHIDISIHTTDDELCALQNNFRNVKYLYLDARCLTSINIESKTGWHHWRALRELYICVDNPPQSFTKELVIEILLCLPLLCQLDIVRAAYTYKPWISFSLDDFETIHSHLPYLVHLGLDLKQLSLSDADLDRMAKVSPARIMNSFKVCSPKTDHRWLCYFARKYPNLHTLDFYSSNFLSEDKYHDINAIPFLQTSSPPFQHLRKLDITYTKCRGNECLFFWDMIRPYNIPLKHVSITIIMWFANPYLNGSYEVPQNITETCLKAASRTIESFSIKAYKEHAIPFSVIDIKDSLYNLVKLNFNNLVSSLELDTLLEVAPRLKDLSLQYTDVKIKGEIYDSKRFGLQTFRIAESTITSDVLRFLSFHCRKLNLMNLYAITVSGSLSVPGCQFIDMTYTRLKALYLNNTRFIINDSKKCPENLNIALVTRPVDDILPKQDYDLNVLPISIGATPTKAHYQWFYPQKNGVIKGISKARGSRMEKFFSNYEENKKITIERAACSKRGNPYINWNNNCVFGYTKIKLGYVDNYNARSH